MIQTIPMFDFTMFIGEIVSVYVDENCVENGRPNALKADPIIMMGTSYFDLKQNVGAAFVSGKELVKPQN